MKFTISNKPKVTDLATLLASSEAHAADHLLEVAEWEELIKAEPVKQYEQGKRTKTRSSLNIKHVRKLLEWRYPVVEQAFLSRGDLFSPVGRDPIDEEIAKHHKKILNYQMNNEIDKVTLFSRMVRAYLNQGTVIMHLGWRTEKGIANYIAPTYKYDFVSPSTETYSQLENSYIDILSKLVENPNLRNSLPVHMVEGAKYYDEHQVVVQVTVTGFVSKETKEEVYLHNHPTLNVVSIYDVFAAPECRTNIQDSPYVIYRYDSAIHDLISNEEFDTKDVDWHNVGSVSSVTYSNASLYPEGDTRRRVAVHEYWGLHDVNGKGDMQQVKVTWVDGHILECVPNPYPDNKHPFYSAAYAPDVSLGSFYGTSDAYLAADHQRILSAVHRGIIDMHANSAYGQRAVAKGALDLTNHNKFVKGEHFEYDPNTITDPRMLFHVFDYPEVSPATMAYLGQINADSDALTGIKSFNEGISGNALGDTAAGVTGVLSATALRESAIVGRLEAMFVQIAKRIMQLNILYLDEEKIIQLAGVEGLIIKAIPNPLIDVKLDIVNQAEDAIKAQEMSFMLQTLGASLPPQLIKETLMEIAELRNLNTFYNKLANYDMSPSEPDPLAQKAAELQVQLLEAQLQNELAIAAEREAKSALHAAKVSTEQQQSIKVAAEAESIAAKTERMVSGRETDDRIKIISAQGESNAAASLIKSSAVKGYQTPTPM